MARPKNPDTKMVTAASGKEYYAKSYEQAKEYGKKYDKEVMWQMRVRVPQQWQEAIEAHVKDKGYKSVNAMINELIMAEIPELKIEK